MKTTTQASPPEPAHPPLACDAYGNLVPVPDGAAAWRICRQTTGRPRAISGPDRTPLRFPIETTVDELVELCGPDTYRIYALDAVGEDLGYVTTIQASRDLRNAAEPDAPMWSMPRAPTLAATSDLRYALEALTQVARINGEALRSVSEAQADWVKAIAMAKGLPRNIPFPPPHLPPQYDDEDDDVDQASAPTQSGFETFLGAIAPMLPELHASWTGKHTAPNDHSTSAAGMAHLARIQAQLTSYERKLLDLMLADGENGAAVAADFAKRSVDEVVAMLRSRVTRSASSPSSSPSEPVLDADTVTSLLRKRGMALYARIAPDVRARLVALVPKLGPKLNIEPELLQTIAAVAKLNDDAVLAWLDSNLAALEAKVAS